MKKNSDLFNKFIYEKWVLKLACLCDVLNLFNELNLSLQSKVTTVFKLAGKVIAFTEQLKLWEQRINKGIFEMFQTLTETLKDNEPEKKFSELVNSR